jgi:hypothetical protein
MHGGVASVVDGRLELEGGYLSLNIAGGLHPVVHLVGSAKVQYKAVRSDLNNGIKFFCSPFLILIMNNQLDFTDKSLPDASAGVILDSRRRSGNAGK